MDFKKLLTFLFFLSLTVSLHVESATCINDTWRLTSNTNAPSARWLHTAVWTGTKMIIWGGLTATGATGSGAVYDPVTNSWGPTGTQNAPVGAYGHTAVWTGSKMIVWGGINNGTALNTGGIYDSATDTWSPVSTTNAPSPRAYHSAVWTGTEMIVWAGQGEFALGDGGRYNPATNTWQPISTANAPPAVAFHTAIWTGDKMIVWGGVSGIDPEQPFEQRGGQYDPQTDTWTSTTLVNAPDKRYGHTAVWTNRQMIIWGGILFSEDGGFYNTGGRYYPRKNSWKDTSTVNGLPTPRMRHVAVWTGREMIIWGGSDDPTTGTDASAAPARYTPTRNRWIFGTEDGAPLGRQSAAAVWTGSEMIVWGGFSSQSGVIATGGLYCAN